MKRAENNSHFAYNINCARKHYHLISTGSRVALRYSFITQGIQSDYVTSLNTNKLTGCSELAFPGQLIMVCRLFVHRLMDLHSSVVPTRFIKFINNICL